MNRKVILQCRAYSLHFQLSSHFHLSSLLSLFISLFSLLSSLFCFLGFWCPFWGRLGWQLTISMQCKMVTMNPEIDVMRDPVATRCGSRRFRGQDLLTMSQKTQGPIRRLEIQIRRLDKVQRISGKARNPEESRKRFPTMWRNWVWS